MARPLSIDTTSILRTLTQEPQKPSVLSEKLKASRSTVHRKLAELLDEGLVVKEGKGPRAAYRLIRPEDALAQAREQVQDSRILLSLPARQAHLVRESLEHFSRIGMGQIEYVLEAGQMGVLKRYDGTPVGWEHLEPARDKLQRFKGLFTGYASNAAHGIHSPRVKSVFQTAWSLSQALRHRLAWDQNPAGSLGTWHDEPMGADSDQVLFVGSDGPTERERFLERRIHLEMDPKTAKALLGALNCGARLYKGDLSVLMDLARAGLLAPREGHQFSEEAWIHGPELLSSTQELLYGLPPQPGDLPEGGKLSASILESLAGALHTLLEEKPEDELRLAVNLGAPEDAVNPDTTLALVERTRNSPFSFQLLDMPEDMMVSFKKGCYRIIGPSKPDDPSLVILGSSHSLQTAIMMARNLANGQQARSFAY